MEGQAEGGDAQQKEESSKRHTYALIRVIFFCLSLFYLFITNYKQIHLNKNKEL